MGQRLCLCEEERTVEEEEEEERGRGKKEHIDRRTAKACWERERGEGPQNLRTLGTSQEKMSRPKWP